MAEIVPCWRGLRDRNLQPLSETWVPGSYSACSSPGVCEQERRRPRWLAWAQMLASTEPPPPAHTSPVLGASITQPWLLLRWRQGPPLPYGGGTQLCLHITQPWDLFCTHTTLLNQKQPNVELCWPSRVSSNLCLFKKSIWKAKNSLKKLTHSSDCSGPWHTGQLHPCSISLITSDPCLTQDSCLISP